MATTKKTATKTAKAAPKKAATKCCAKKACASKTCAKRACAKKQQNEKHKFIIFGLVLTLVLLGSSLGVITWARYSSDFGSATASVSVADWKVALQDKSGTAMTNFSLTLTPENEYTHVANGKIAPGSTASDSFIVDFTGTEVDTEYEIKFKTTGGTKPTNATLSVTPTATGVTVSNSSCSEDASTHVTTCTGILELPTGASAGTYSALNGKVSFGILVDWDDHGGYDASADNTSDTTDGSAASKSPITIEVSAKAAQYVGRKSS